jgi:hypothetical protein
LLGIIGYQAVQFRFVVYDKTVWHLRGFGAIASRGRTSRDGIQESRVHRRWKLETWLAGLRSRPQHSSG